MTKWQKIEKLFAACTSESEANEIAKKLNSSTTFIFVEGPVSDAINGSIKYATGAANRLYQRTMVEGWNCRAGKPVGPRQMRIFI